MGQPLYKYLVRGLLDRLLPDPAIVTDLPSSARATLTRQDDAEAAHPAPALWRAAGARQGGPDRWRRRG